MCLCNKMSNTESLIDIIPEDILGIIMEKLNMFDHSKFSMINETCYNLGNSNYYWKKHYNKLLDNYYIGPNSVHNGPVTYYKCNVGPYPGWGNIHTPLALECNKKDHYISLDFRESKAKWKDYREHTKIKYKSLILNDRSSKKVPIYKINEIENRIRCLKKEIEYIKNFNQSIDKLNEQFK